LLMIALVITGTATMMIGGCGGADSASADTETTAASSSPSETVAAGGDGAALAEEILATFDQLVADVAELATPQPDPGVLKPQLQELYDRYETTMTDLNARYLALRDADQTAFQDCNRYLYDNRPQHVSVKDNALSDPVAHYNLEVGDQELVSLLSKRPVELLDIAVAQN